MTVEARRASVEPGHEALSISRQCALLGVSRSGFYYRPVGVSDEDLACMRMMDEVFMKRPYFGSRRLRDALSDRGHAIGRDHVRRLMRLMGLEAIYPKRRLSVRNGDHTVFRTCCGAWRSVGRTRSGAATSPTSS